MEMLINDNITAIYNKQRTSLSEKKVISEDLYNNRELENNKSAQLKNVGIGICSTLGVVASLALLSKFDKSHKYTLNPLKILKSNLKNSYLLNTKYKTKEIVTMGAGSITGGLLGGYIFDDKSNMNAKVREGIVQICNITFPIALVEGLSVLGTKVSDKLMPNWSKSKNVFKRITTKLPATAGAIIGLITGMYIGNKTSNKLNEKVFKVKDDRPIKWTDFSAHVDDIGVAATFIADDNIITNSIRRLIPAALVVPGYETGIKKEVK